MEEAIKRIKTLIDLHQLKAALKLLDELDYTRPYPCCAAMKHAVEMGYIIRPIIYDKEKKMRHLAPTIIHPNLELGHPSFSLNLCPWCGAPVYIRQVTNE